MRYQFYTLVGKALDAFIRLYERVPGLYKLFNALYNWRVRKQAAIKLAGVIFRIMLLGFVGISGVFALDLMYRSHPGIPSLVLMYAMSILIALLAGVLAAVQIHDYKHPEDLEED